MPEPNVMPEPPITSLQNARVKAAVALRARRNRERAGLTIVDGARELLRALAAGVVVEEAFVCPELARTGDAEAAVDRLAGRSGTHSVSAAVLDKVAFGERNEGIVAVIRTPSIDLGALHLPVDPLVVVLEAVEKPGNLGAVLRSADGAGADAVIAADPLTDLFNPNAIRASLGTIFAVPLAAATSTAVLEWLLTNGLRIFAARVDGSADYASVDLTGSVAIVLGSEARGLTTAWRSPKVEAVRLPMLGVADSLNVSAAAAVLLYEARRQRTGASPT